MKHGAVLTPELEWQRNKSAATILFVQEIERLLTINLLLPEQCEKLSTFVLQLKHGVVDVIDFAELDNFFDSAQGLANFLKEDVIKKQYD